MLLLLKNKYFIVVTFCIDVTQQDLCIHALCRITITVTMTS